VLLEAHRVLPGCDVHVAQIDLPAVDLGVAVRQIGPARAHRLDLGAGEGKARLDLPIDRVIEPGLPVIGEHQLGALLLLVGRCGLLGRATIRS